MKHRLLLSSLIVGIVVAVTVRNASALPKPPEPDPADFVSVIDNPYFPLIPGTTFFYEGRNEGVPTSNTVAVTHDTKTILGIQATVVRDQGFEDGVLTEDTLDWYAQDDDGNVWYLGEDTRELDENGNVISTEGSWEAGVDDARAGFIMLADPQPSDHYRQEFLRDVAEDGAQVLRNDLSLCIDFGCFDDVVVIRETNRLEPNSAARKYYAPGVGQIYDRKTKGGHEFSELVAITTGN